MKEPNSFLDLESSNPKQPMFRSRYYYDEIFGIKKIGDTNFQPAAPHVQTAKPFVRQYAHMGFVDISIPHSGNMKFLDFFPEWNPQPPQIQAVGSNPGSWIKSRQLDDSKSLHT